MRASPADLWRVPPGDPSAPRGSEAESAYVWIGLEAALLLSTIGGVGMCSVVNALSTGEGVTRRQLGGP
jgi:hypothetical protein